MVEGSGQVEAAVDQNERWTLKTQLATVAYSVAKEQAVARVAQIFTDFFV
jgi:hypothetical protein